ncbi:hypothetical protein MBLNU230_g2505t1 [Neophaeotheca triangularis]
MPVPVPSLAFTIPSIDDDTPLDCRLYHPGQLTSAPGPVLQADDAPKAAIIAHPYAPLGGSFDDAVVLSLADTLLKNGLVVVTFNFRGAAGSHGRTSWTSKAEQADYASVVGLTVNYLYALSPPHTADEAHRLSTVHSLSNALGELLPPTSAPSTEESALEMVGPPRPVLVLAGYSYGSLVLSRLPTIETILQRFDDAETGTAAAEILLRARSLAEQSRLAIAEGRHHAAPRGRRENAESDPSSGGARQPQLSPVVIGGEETDPSERRRSREGRRSGEIVRRGVEVPRRIRNKIHRHSSGARSSDDGVPSTSSPHSSERERGRETCCTHSVSVAYLLVSPLLPPISHALGLSFNLGGMLQSHREHRLVLQNHPTLALFGSVDSFTSSRKLQVWCERLSKTTDPRFDWAEIREAGHFWTEPGALDALLSHVEAWVTGLQAHGFDRT